jgi:hypothetical protein
LDTHNYLIIANDKIITSDILSYEFNKQTDKYNITFQTGKTYSYNRNSVRILTAPTLLESADYRIIHNGKEFSNISAIYEFQSDTRTYWHICFKGGYEKDYEKDFLHIIPSCLTNSASKTVFDYLKQVADYISLRSNEDVKLLSKQYEKLDYVGDDTAFASFVKYPARTEKSRTVNEPIFPFGCNKSQYKAVHHALENQISIIQGPPGTGKTQTILNIVANLLIAGKTVQIVSNNNSATENVFEKLSSYDLDFIAARLGNSSNKEQFIAAQKGTYPDALKTWTSDTTGKNELLIQIKHILQNLQSGFETEEQLSSAQQQLHQLQTEAHYFFNYLKENGLSTAVEKRQKQISSETLFKIWTQCQIFEDKGRKPSFFFKFKCCFIYRIAKWSFFKNGTTQVISKLQSLFYTVKLSELSHRIQELERLLALYNQKKLSEELTEKSLRYLKATLAERYKTADSRVCFSSEDL